MPGMIGDPDSDAISRPRQTAERMMGRKDNSLPLFRAGSRTDKHLMKAVSMCGHMQAVARQRDTRDASLRVWATLETARLSPENIA